jgi:hypothetical protein
VKRIKALCVVAAVFVMGTLAVGQLESILKAGGVVGAISLFGKKMNDATNKLMGHQDSPIASTKIVPILSVGKGGYIGAAQVMGPKKQVDRVQAVGQLEVDFAGHAVRIRGLVPISSKDAKGSSKLDRVPNVGVSAILDFKL